MKEYKIASIAGDGIGKEVVPEAQKILKEVANQHQFKLQIDEFDFIFSNSNKLTDCTILSKKNNLLINTSPNLSCFFIINFSFNY